MAGAVDSARGGLATVVAADGHLLDRVLDSTFSSLHQGLDRSAYGAWDETQRKASWAVGHQQRFALVQNDDVLATAQRFDLSGTFDRSALSICAIGSVWSAPRQSGSHARTLIERLFEDARQDGADLVLLFLSEETKSALPERFERIPTSDVDVRVIESPRHGAPMTLVRSGEDRDLAAIVAMGEARATQCRFHLNRNEALVKHVITRKRLLAGLSAHGARQLEFAVAEEGITAAAYVVISRIGERWTIEECGDRDQSGARVGAILQALIAREPAESRPVISGWLPSGFAPPQLTIAPAAASGDAIFARFMRPRATPLRLSAEQVLYWRSDFFGSASELSPVGTA